MDTRQMHICNELLRLVRVSRKQQTRLRWLDGYVQYVAEDYRRTRPYVRVKMD